MNSKVAMVLAGGLGTRLKAVLGDGQKVVAEVNGRPFLRYLLDSLVAAGFQEVVLCTGFREDAVRAALGDRHGTMKLSYSRETTPMGTAGALALALPMIEGDRVLVMNGDSFCDVDLAAVWIASAAKKVPMMVVARVEDVRRFGSVIVEGDFVTGFEEKAARDGGGWINAGIYVFDRAVIESIPAGKPVSLEREVLPGLVRKGIAAYKSEGLFLDIGTPESYSTARELLPREGNVSR